TAREITAQVMFKDIARPSSFRAGVPADLEAVAMTLLAHQRDRRYPTARAAIDALLGCADVPRDGRGELAQLLAERFPTGPGAQAPRGRRGAGEPRAVRDGPITMAAPDSAVSSSAGLAVPGAGTPRRGVFAATLGMFALGILAAALVLARGEIAQSQTTDRGAPPAAAEAAAVPAARVVAPAAGDAGRTGELAIIVRPWAMIWLNGKPSGQTPFRSAVPAGRYRVRLANDGAGRDEVTIVVVEPDRTATVERTW
ncbi:MAG TPA: PEGA domain-containing protein, partial [Kofleriaceae bacterium]|nr:PEGA domain-containing protein [Kofleriaceae bacterium]